MEFSGEMIAKLVKDVLKDMETAASAPAGGELTVPIGVSNRHVHLYGRYHRMSRQDSYGR